MSNIDTVVKRFSELSLEYESYEIYHSSKIILSFINDVITDEPTMVDITDSVGNISEVLEALIYSYHKNGKQNSFEFIHSGREYDVQIVRKKTKNYPKEGEIVFKLKIREIDEITIDQLQFSDMYLSANTDAVNLKGVPNQSEAIVSFDVEKCHIVDLQVFRTLVVNEHKKGKKDEFFIDYNSVRYRISYLDDLEGSWYVLRKPKQKIMPLHKLGGDFNTINVRRISKIGYDIRHNMIGSGGMILIAGATSSGKSNTAYSILKSYLDTYGDVGVTIEDPPEMIISGRHGISGHCYQMELKEGQKFSDLIVKSLRFSPKYIFLGELRRPEDAYEAIRTAITGHLVITTIHAGDIMEAISVLIRLASSCYGTGDLSLAAARDEVSKALALVIHQQLRHKKDTVHLHTDFLYLRDNVDTSDDGNYALLDGNSIRSKVSSGAFISLSDDIRSQGTKTKTMLADYDRKSKAVKTIK